MGADNTAVRLFRRRAEQISLDTRRQLALPGHSPLSAFVLAQHLRISIFTLAELLPSTGKKQQEMLPGFSALLMRNQSGEPLIIHNQQHSAYRQQSNLMHELAHHLLDHQIPDHIRRISLDFGLRHRNTQQEQEAEILGGCLQLPRPALRWAVRNNWSKQQIARYYQASLQMINYRLNISDM